MEFSIEKKDHANYHKYDKKVLDTAYAFTKEAYGEFQEFIRGMVLFGSSARHDGNDKSDIDILVVFDDVLTNPTPDIVEAYKIITEKLIQKHSTRIHVTTMRFTTFYEQVRVGDPIGINILRDGIALVDKGFFDPLQALLRMGKIRPTYESIWNYMHKSSKTMHNSRWHLFRACEDLYWAVTDAAHAAIMKQGILPPSPRHMHTFFLEHVVPTKQFNKGHAKKIKFFYDLYKSIDRKELRDITGQQYEQYYLDAKHFVLDVQAFLEKK